MSRAVRTHVRGLATLVLLVVTLPIEILGRDLHHRPRAEATIDEARRLYAEWLQRETPSGAQVGDLPWRAAPSAMEVESLVAYETASLVWTPSPNEPHIARGLAWYLQSRVVEYLFNLRYALPGHSAESVRLFGGHIPWQLPSLRVSRWSTLESSRDVRRVPEDLDARSVRSAIAFATLERYLGWPVLQGALAAMARAPETPLTKEHVNRTISAAAGQDLTWLFEVAFDSDARVAYGLLDFGSGPAVNCGSPCYLTTVTARRLGNAPFTGRSEPRVGEFDSGSGIVTEVTFADGQTLRAAWDGRDPQRTFTFHSPSPAISAQLDPEGVLLLDPNRLDHRMVSQPDTNVPLVKWVARWATWLQHAMLTYTMFV